MSVSAQTGIQSSSKMTVELRFLILLCYILSCVDSAPAPVLQRNKYSNSFLLTRTTRSRVQQLLKKYNLEQLENRDFEDRSRQLKSLPLLSTDFYIWLQLTDWERLHAAFRDMQTYWNMLEWKREQLEMEENEHNSHTSLPQSIKHVQLDLRDLMSQVNSQMDHIRMSQMNPTTPAGQASFHPETGSKTMWDRRVEGYIILRDLDLYLTKLARDFLLLASRAH